MLFTFQELNAKLIIAMFVLLKKKKEKKKRKEEKNAMFHLVEGIYIPGPSLVTEI